MAPRTRSMARARTVGSGCWWDHLSSDLVRAILAELDTHAGACAACVCQEWSEAWTATVASGSFLRIDKRTSVALYETQTLGSVRLPSSGTLVVTGFASGASSHKFTLRRLWAFHALPITELDGSDLPPTTLNSVEDDAWLCWPRALAATAEHLYVAQCTRNAEAPRPALAKLALPHGRLVAQSAAENVAQCVSVAVVGGRIYTVDVNASGHNERQVWSWDLDLKTRTPFARGVLTMPCALVAFDGHLCAFDLECGLLLLTADGVVRRTLATLKRLQDLFMPRRRRRAPRLDKLTLAVNEDVLFVVVGMSDDMHEHHNGVLLLDRTGNVMQHIRYAGAPATTVCATREGLYTTHWSAQSHSGGYGMGLIPAASRYCAREGGVTVPFVE